MSNRIVHFEIPFDDGDRAKTFYRDVFGWKVEDMPELQYTMALSGPVGESGMPEEPGFVNGGMFQRQGSLDRPVLVIDVADIDAALEQIGTNGGSTVEPRMAVGEMGSCAYFKDSEGNLMGLWQSA